jgi:hypothetical protein
MMLATVLLLSLPLTLMLPSTLVATGRKREFTLGVSQNALPSPF